MQFGAPCEAGDDMLDASPGLETGVGNDHKQEADDHDNATAG